MGSGMDGVVGGLSTSSPHILLAFGCLMIALCFALSVEQLSSLHLDFGFVRCPATAVVSGHLTWGSVLVRVSVALSVS